MTTFEKVKKIVADKLGVDEAKVTETAAFVNDLGADSLDVVEFVMEVGGFFSVFSPAKGLLYGHRQISIKGI